jgi:hypothetical protein
VRVPAEHGHDLLVPTQNVLEPVAVPRPDGIHEGDAEGHRRVVHGHQHRPLRRRGESGVQPADRLVGEVAPVLAGHGRVAEHDRDPLQVMDLVDGPVTAVRVAEEHPPEVGPLVMVSRARQHRRRRPQQPAGRLILLDRAVIGHVTGDEHGVHRPGQGRQIAHDPFGTGPALLTAVDVGGR